MKVKKNEPLSTVISDSLDEHIALKLFLSQNGIESHAVRSPNTLMLNLSKTRLSVKRMREAVKRILEACK